MKKNAKHDNEKESFAKRHDQKIKCDVEACKHNDCDSGCCDLVEIKVSCSCNPKDAEEKDATICENFECNCDNDDCCCNEKEED